jgi:ABC-type nitrate/sulfonate/bicarbonate transport system permease component
VNYLKQHFTPNAVLDKGALLRLVFFQLIVMAAIWFFSPWRLLPTPVEIYSALGDLWIAGLGVEVAASIKLNAEAIFFATVVSLFFSYLSVLPFFRPMIAFIGKLRFLPMVGLPLVFALLTNSGTQLKVSLLAFVVSVFFIPSMCNVINTAYEEQSDYFDLSRTLRMNEWQVTWEVVVLGQADKAFDVLQNCAAMGFAFLTLVESTVRSQGGVGTMLMDQSKHFVLPAIMAIQIVILLVGWTQDYVIGVAKGFFCEYAVLEAKKK